MSEFTASNGGTVRVIETADDGTRTLVKVDRAYNHRLPGGESTAYLIDAQVDALREFFQHERDEALGRWRWPENPDYVVYRTESADDIDGRAVSVVQESRGVAYVAWEKYATDSEDRLDPAAAYFDAHPEPKPWHQAQTYEVWAVDHGGDGFAPYRVIEKFGVHTFEYVDGSTNFPVTDPRITAGRRIWPEVS